MNAAETVASTAAPAFAVNLAGKILAWNRGSEDLFGHKASEVIGRSCWRLLSGRDIYGNDYCGKVCPLRRMARECRPVNPNDLVFRSAVNEPIKTRVWLVVVSGAAPSEATVVHLLCPPTQGEQEADAPAWRLSCGNRAKQLSCRELEVLGLLSEGKGTREIAEVLGLSSSTVRNHVHNTLHKLRVHSRLEAVALAHRLRLLC